MPPLDPQQGYVFRITHVKNVPWILDHGLHCRNSETLDPHFEPIGMENLIQRRSLFQVPIPPGGNLSDYVPFYFTPHSIMLFNIKTGHGEVNKRPNSEIVVLVSSLPRLLEVSARFVFTNGHALLRETSYFSSLDKLGEIDWTILKDRDFKRDPEDPGKQGRYQAEALVHRLVPVDALLGIACYDNDRQQEISAWIKERGLTLPVKVLPDWYY